MHKYLCYPIPLEPNLDRLLVLGLLDVLNSTLTSLDIGNCILESIPTFAFK